MSAAFGKAIGPIAKKIGGEVAEGLSKTADDWGWKGPKKGEISGGEYLKRRGELDDKIKKKLYEYEVTATPRELPELDSAITIMEKKRQNLNNKFLKQQGIDQTAEWFERSDFRLGQIAGQFRVLEDADVPRRWTGKLREALMKNDPRHYDSNPYTPTIGVETLYINTIAKAMEDMTESQRETFVTLIPEWDDTFEKLVEVSRSL